MSDKVNSTTGRDMPRFWQLFEDVTGNRPLEPVQKGHRKNEENRDNGKRGKDEKVEGAANTNKPH